MAFDLLVKGGSVVDGTGRAAFTADVAVKEGVVVEVGSVTGPARRVIDAGGLVVTPGFIDVHTHYDAQILWEPELKASTQYGVTTVVTGNCGIGVAPLAGGDPEYLVQLLANVEGMPEAALQTGLSWDWESFAEYLERLDVPLGPNLIPLVGHSPLRYSVMRAAAYERHANEDEVAEMKSRLSEALYAGAWGFSSSFAATHNDLAGRPAPSRLAGSEEMRALASAVAPYPFGVIGISPESKLRGMNDQDRRTLMMLSVEGRASVNWNPIVYSPALPDLWRTNLAVSQEAADAGASVFGVWNPISAAGSRVDLTTCFLFMALPHWREVATQPLDTKLRMFGDPAVRRALASDLEQDQSLGALTARLRSMWEVLRITEVAAAENAPWVGRTVGEIARASNRKPLDTMLDIAVADRLATVFMQEESRAETDDQRAAIAALSSSPYVLFGGSDAGAHLDMLANESLYAKTIQRRVREDGLLPLEEAIRRFTSAIADAIGVEGRGRLIPGMAADLVLFDLDSIGAGDARLARDLPGGCERLVTEAEGVHRVIVNGEDLLVDGDLTGIRPGRLLRSGTHARPAVPPPGLERARAAR